MPQVLVEQPDSFKVMDFLGALFANQYPDLFLVEPQPRQPGSTDAFGRPIGNRLPNIPTIGISILTQTDERELGFLQTHEKNTVKMSHFYSIDAFLLLEVDPAQVPDDSEGETWVLQVKELEKISIFQPIAVALAKEFNVNIILTPATMYDDDPAHLRTRPVREDIPGSPLICPVIIRKVDPA